MQKYTETFVQNKTPLVYTPQGIVAPVIFTTSPSYYINQLIFINYTYFQDCCTQHNMSDFFSYRWIIWMIWEELFTFAIKTNELQGEPNIWT